MPKTLPPFHAEPAPAANPPADALAALASLPAVLADLVNALRERPGAAPELVTRRQAAAIWNVSLSEFGSLEASGELGVEPIRIGTGRLVRYSLAELRAWIAAGAPCRRMWREVRATAMRKTA